jgi:NADPH2:quinone reductase
MRAAYIEAHGAAESIRVGDLPSPTPDPGEVLVRVKAVSFNPIDLYLRSGAIPMPMAFPYIVGADLAGVVEQVGRGVTRFQPGDRVWGSNQGLLGRQGVACELAAVGEEWLYPTPEGVTDPQAAAIALVGITAHLGLFEIGRLQPGETAYVSGGSGGVGSIVIQMAKAAGARIATTAGGPDHVAQCRQLGADLALDYKADDVPARLREFAPEGIDVWYETQREPDLMTTVPLLRRGGRVVLIAGRDARPSFPLGSFYPRDCSILGFAMFNATPDQQRRAADDINRWLASGKLAPQIGRTFPLAQTAEAQALLEANTIHKAGTLSGKVVVTLP